MTTLEPNWWHGLAACAACGTPLDKVAPSGTRGACPDCGQGYAAHLQYLDWDRPASELVAETSRWLQQLRPVLNPLTSPLLPMRYLTRTRVERYYRRTLTDRDLACRWAAHYLRELALPQAPVALDFGCGRGRNLGLLRQLGIRAVGQDIAANPWWKQLPNIGFQIVKDLPRLPWRNASFDLVTEVMVIHYLTEDQLVAHFHEMARVLKPSGTWVLLEANERSYGVHWVRSQVGSLHSLERVRALARECGLIERDCSYEGFYAPAFPQLVNYLRKQCSPAPLDIADYDSWIAARIPPKRRGLWLLRLGRTAT